MRAKAVIEHPDTTEISFTFTMPLGDWKRLRKTIVESKTWTSYPSFKLVEYIDELGREMEKMLYRKEDED
jgi:hypothetical protein